MIMKAWLFWTMSFGLSLFNSLLLPASYSQLISDEDYVASLNLPSDGDSFGLALVGAVALALIMVQAHIILHVIFIFVLRRKSIKSVSLDEIRLKSGETWFNAVRKTGYLVSALLVYGYLRGYLKFYPLECLFYVTLIAVVMLYVIWIIAAFRKRQPRCGRPPSPRTRPTAG